MEYIGVITHLLTIDPNFLGHPRQENIPVPFGASGILIRLDFFFGMLECQVNLETSGIHSGKLT